MRIQRLFWPSALFLAVSTAGCVGSDGDRVLSIEGEGVVQGVVLFDANGNRQADANDPPLASVGVHLLLGGVDTIRRATSDINGLFELSGVPVGSYEVAVDTTTIGDSVEVVNVNLPNFTLGPSDTVPLSISIGLPLVTVAELRALPPGERVFVEGIALNTRDIFGERSVHLAGSSRAIRVTRVQPGAVFAGDSVRFLGTSGRAIGQPTLDAATAFVLASLEVPLPERITTATAAAADGGRLDAALVEVIDATIQSTATVQTDFTMTVDDGSGPLEVILDSDVGFTFAGLGAGVRVDLVGLLVPVDQTTWVLKPRSDADITIR